MLFDNQYCLTDDGVSLIVVYCGGSGNRRGSDVRSMLDDSSSSSVDLAKGIIIVEDPVSWDVSSTRVRSLLQQVNLSSCSLSASAGGHTPSASASAGGHTPFLSSYNGILWLFFASAGEPFLSCLLLLQQVTSSSHT